jgi:hypothetical protein
MYVKILNNQVEIYPYSAQQLIADNPDTSFPSPTPDSTLAEYGVFPVVPTPQPAYDPVTQNLTELNPIQVDGLWVQQWSVTQASPEEVAQRKEQLTQQNKATGKQLLTDTDWTAIPSVADPAQSNPYLMNQNEFFIYRSAVRDIVLNPTWDAVFPVEPVEVWSS